MTEQFEQGSAEWLAQRLGKATASRMADICAKTKSGWGASRDNYLAELVVERMTGQTAERFKSAAMDWGIKTEPEAADAYAYYRDVDVATVGFIDHPVIKMAGASPDRLVGSDGLVEIKCPNTATHIDTLLSGTIPGKYQLQMKWQMACTGRQWCDYVSFDSRMPEKLRLFVRRIERQHAEIESLECIVREFLDEVDNKVRVLGAI